MKKTIVALMLCIVSISIVFSQEYKIEEGAVCIEKVVSTEMTIEQAHDAIETFFASYYGDSNQTNKLNTTNHLVYIGLYTRIASIPMSPVYVNANHNIDVYLKDGRSKIKISCDFAEVTTSKSVSKYRFVDYVPFTDNYKMLSMGIYKSTAIKAGKELVKRMQETLAAIENVLSQKPISEEDW